jgi:tripartite-type tricarboxylate transporter receptor subunit TctC
MKRLLQSALLLCAALTCVATTFAQQFPSRPIRFVVPFPPGGNLDFIGRILQPRLSEFLGVAVVIDNRGGAAGIVGADFTARQPADGYTILLGNTGTFGLFPVLYPKLPYDALKDFAAVGQISASTQLMAAHRSVPARSLKEVIALAKTRPGKLTCAIAGLGTLAHFSLEMLKKQAAMDILLVPYKGSGPAVVDLVAGNVDLIIDAVSVSMPYISSGRLRPIAIVNNTRLASLPDVPTFEEQGLTGFVARGWQGLLVPAGTPAPVIARLSEALMKTLAQPEVRERFATQGLSPTPSTPEQFAAHIRAEIEKWGKVAKAANIRVD